MSHLWALRPGGYPIYLVDRETRKKFASRLPNEEIQIPQVFRMDNAGQHMAQERTSNLIRQQFDRNIYLSVLALQLSFRIVQFTIISMRLRLYPNEKLAEGIFLSQLHIHILAVPSYRYTTAF
jgi:hypothetical protein